MPAQARPTEPPRVTRPPSLTTLSGTPPCVISFLLETWNPEMGHLPQAWLNFSRESRTPCLLPPYTHHWPRCGSPRAATKPTCCSSCLGPADPHRAHTPLSSRLPQHPHVAAEVFCPVHSSAWGVQAGLPVLCQRVRTRVRCWGWTGIVAKPLSTV